MGPTAKQPSAVADAVSQMVGGFGDLEPWVRQNLALFPVPSPGLAGPLFEAQLRVAQAVPWLEGALGQEVVDRLVQVIARFGAGRLIDRTRAIDSLVGEFGLAGTLVGTEASPRRGPDSLRAALWVCHAHWTQPDHRQTGTVDAFASIIRNTVKIRDSSATQRHPVARVLADIERTSTLAEFLSATDVFLSSEQVSLRNAWAHIRPHLSGFAGKVRDVPSAPRVPEKSRFESDFAEEEAIERAIEGVHRVNEFPPPGAAPLSPGEPAVEIVTRTIISPMLGRASNPDAKRISKYRTQQVVWTQNTLLLTNHPDVLPEFLLKRVLRVLTEELLSVEDAELRLGLAGLLLQSVTGRTGRSLVEIRVVDKLAAEPVASCELSVAESTLRLRVFFSQDAGTPTGYFQPTAAQAALLEPVAEFFVLPLPGVVIGALQVGDAVRRLATTRVATLDGMIRAAARHVSEKLGMPITAGQVRRSLSAHLYESCRDTALTQLICTDTVGLSDTPSHYYAPRSTTVALTYHRLLANLFDLAEPAPETGAAEVRVGAKLLVLPEIARQLTASLGAVLHGGVERLVATGQARRIHHAMTSQLGCMFLAACTHRPVDSLFALTLDDIELESGAALFRDKVHDPAHDPRLVALPTCVVDQIQAHLAHLAGLAAQDSALASHVAAVLKGKAPLLFALDERGSPVPLTMASFTDSLPPAWRQLPLNWGRTWVRTRSLELGLGQRLKATPCLRPELASIELGHLEAVGYPFSNGSPTEPAAFVAASRTALDRTANEQGWVVRRGMGEATDLGIPLRRLRSWASRVRRHEKAARDHAQAWRNGQKAQMRSYRRQAEEDVLADPAIVSAGIDVLFANTAGPWKKHPMSKEQAEALRDALFEDAVGNTALGLARAAALCRIVRCVNKRAGIKGQDPAGLIAMRRPVDNAFVPGMMVAVRQVRALRDAALQSAEDGPGDWKDFALACARVAHALAVFGFCDNPVQILGALEHRSRLLRSSKLHDAVVASWGPDPEQVMGLRGLAALALGRLAKKYPEQAVPSRKEINTKLAALLPDWAKPSTSRDGKEAHDETDWLALLCETVSVANRFELSPAARLALDLAGGSVNAHPAEQIALIDGDPAGALPRSWESEGERAVSPRTTPTQARTGNARAQYLALCRAIPTPEKDLVLPLTGKAIPADQLNQLSTRGYVIEEVTAQLAADSPKTVLQPIVRLLATWVLDMFKEGTQNTDDPAHRTISTYLTRIGGGLVELFGNSSLADLDDAELEDAYTTVVEANEDSRDKAAAAIIAFHDCCSRAGEFPELDLSEVRAYLASDHRSVDARLVLSAERDAAVALLVDRSSRVGGTDTVGRRHARTVRQASAAMPLYAYAGARRSEVLGLRFADVLVEDSTILARIRANRSRRLKTRAARRTIQLAEDIAGTAVKHVAEWIHADNSRLLRWRNEGAYLFSPLESGRRATGRSAIAEACAKGLSEVTGRPSERLHGLRHLVAFERITPLPLHPDDRQALLQLDVQAISLPTEIVLPRDLAAQVISLGHAHWATTLRCYYHLPWLLRSRADAAIRKRYCNRRGAAAVMGLTLPAVDRISQLAKPLPAARAWIDHVLAPRTPPAADQPKAPPTPTGNRIWTAVELGQLLECVERTGSLTGALAVVGAHSDEADRLRKAFLMFEQRLGCRLLGGEWIESLNMPRRIVRSISAAKELARWWSLFDEAPEVERERLVQIANHVFEWMSPDDRDAIKLEAPICDSLVAILVQAGMSEDAAERRSLGLGFEALRIERPARDRPTAPVESEDEPAAAQHKRYLGLSIKRVLGVIWVANRLRNEPEPNQSKRSGGEGGVTGIAASAAR